MHLLDIYPSTIDDCAALIERQGVLPITQIKTISESLKAHRERIIFDNLTLSILISKIIVTNKYNLVFYFLDGRTFRYRLTDVTPKSRPGFYERTQRKQAILDLYQKGVPSSHIAERLGISKNTVRTIIRRHKLKTK